MRPASARYRRRPAAAALPPGLEGLAPAADSGALAVVSEALAQHGALYAWDALLAAAAAYAAAAWPSRPRGWCSKLVEVRPSQVAGLGVYAVADIKEGTVLGAYPGRPRTPAGMAAKSAVAPGARDYCFRTRDDRLLDPTDATGKLSPSPAPGLPWLPIDVSLAYINEPPKGAGGTNVTAEDDPNDGAGLLCVAARDIYAGEELWLDYGLQYDEFQ
ncbi:SET domain-containing -lysine N-methyltransferase isoform B [Micractinium conductrix]|uniref:SET domain-containing -lysine N-methyltransferase isoform B n=1 Tax=Micractinium conductrix TaxID=554055 RepID=A0A2P6VPA1_9CHLO|nr:SET domain-containing -lysine N-methyltransferase isoform B [Micractinium conductrix]|eukprot:PSC75926.1 SET domain-containing -lysine N-methyltransferase isoform B [Micractinium conductrix]